MPCSFGSFLTGVFFGFPGCARVKNLPAMQDTNETQVRSLGREDPLEKEVTAHSSVLAWRISRTEEPGGLQSTGSQSQTRLKGRSTARELLCSVV